MRTNSIIGDTMDFSSVEPPVTPKIKESDWQKIANSKAYPEFSTYLEGRKDYYRKYLPDGRPVENLSTEERIAYWNVATILIREIEGIQAALLLSKR